MGNSRGVTAYRGISDGEARDNGSFSRSAFPSSAMYLGAPPGRSYVYRRCLLAIYPGNEPLLRVEFSG